MGIKTSKIKGYNYWASYFINNDASGLSIQEKSEADEFLRRMQREYGTEAYIADAGESSEFGYPEYGGLKGSIIDYTVAVIERMKA